MANYRVQSSPFPRQARAERERIARYKSSPTARTSLRLYSTQAWRKGRAEFLAESDQCCVPGCRIGATIVDHRLPHRGRNDLFFDRANWQRMCKHHHDSKTAKLDGGFGRAAVNRADDDSGFGV